jgi:hypothetical protein
MRLMLKLKFAELQTRYRVSQAYVAHRGRRHPAQRHCHHWRGPCERWELDANLATQLSFYDIIIMLRSATLTRKYSYVC